MEQTVRVRKVFPDGTAEVVHIRESACSGDCHKCSGCGAAKETLLLRAENPIGARVGDKVVVTSQSAALLRGAAVLYMLPLALFFLGYLAGYLLLEAGALFAGIGFALGIACVILYDRTVAEKEKTTYTITCFSGDQPGKN